MDAILTVSPMLHILHKAMNSMATLTPSWEKRGGGMPSMCRRACLRRPVAATTSPLCWSGPMPYPSHTSTMGTVALTCWRKGETCPPSDLLLATTGITVCRSTGIQWHITNSQPGETGRTSLCDPLLDYWIGGTHMLTARETFSMQGCRFPLNNRLPSYLLPLTPSANVSPVAGGGNGSPGVAAWVRVCS